MKHCSSREIIEKRTLNIQISWFLETCVIKTEETSNRNFKINFYPVLELRIN